MKPAAFALPLVTLAAGGFWIISQQNSASVLEKENEELRSRIAHQAGPSGAESSPNPHSTRDRRPKQITKEKLDWKQVLEKLGPMMRGGGVGDVREMVRFQTRLQAMSVEEIVAALDEIAGLDVPATDRALLEQMMMGSLIQKDPKLALDRSIGRLGEDDANGASWMLSSALGEWSKKEPSLAAAWLDEQVAAGKLETKSLDGKNRVRSQFEGALINALLASDPDAASRRLGALPENQRADALRYQFSPVEEAGQAALAKIIREQLPQKEQIDILANPAIQLAQKDYASVTRYLDRIAATPEERKGIAGKTAGQKISMLSYNQKIGREDIEGMRGWLATQAPESTDRITGEALGSISPRGKKNSFEDTAALAVEFHESSGNDDVMVGFLGSHTALSNRQAARDLAGKISDEKRRADVLKRLK